MSDNWCDWCNDKFLKDQKGLSTIYKAVISGNKLKFCSRYCFTDYLIDNDILQKVTKCVDW